MTPQERKNFESIRDNVHSEQAQKQEPVGRFSKFTDGLWKEVTATSAGQPLYADPPQRQPLTRNDLWKLWCNAKAENEYMFWLVFARAIEATHGIKGEE
jgi:hypothetical protein